MTITRREFVGASIAVACAPAFAGSRSPLRILVLGGTGFIGPHLVRHAASRGHEVTLFNRGRTNTHLFPDVEKLIGDRDGGLDALRGREWDACIDNTGYVPSHVRDSAELLRDAVGRYLFTSTRQVYADPFTGVDNREDESPLKDEPPDTEEYGARKVWCERAAADVFGDRCTIVRPTAVAGPGDRSDRFTWWPVRVDRGGDVIVPRPGTDPIQYIDVRDLAEFMVRLVEEDTSGSFNAAGPHADLSIAALAHGVRAITSAEVRFVWVTRDFLEEHDIGPRREMPLWSPPIEPGTTRSPLGREKSVAHGLRFRPLADTARATLDWFRSRPAEEQTLRRGLSPERESELLAAWRARPRQREEEILR